MRAALVDRFLGFIKERELIRLRKEAGFPWPWTKDKILQMYKFTHVHRCYDRTTDCLVKEFYNPNRDHAPAVILYNCGVFRWFGSIEFARVLGWQTSHHGTRMKRLAAKELKKDRKVFTGAYIITSGGVPGPKEDYVSDLLGVFWRRIDILVKIAEDTNSWEQVYAKLHEYPGFGGSGFMCKEVLLDAMLTPVLSKVKDRMTWTPVGPGARRGLNRVLQRSLDQHWTEEGALRGVQELHERIVGDWSKFVKQNQNDKSFDRARPMLPLAVTDVQFQLCEFDKYERVRLGQGRPRSLYVPPQGSN